MCFRPAQATAGETGERGTACYNRREMIDGKPGERESIWSVPSSWHGWYLGVFALFTVFSAGYICWEEFHNPENEGFYETFLAMGHAASPFVILSAGFAVITVEVIAMIGDRLFQAAVLERGVSAGAGGGSGGCGWIGISGGRRRRRGGKSSTSRRPGGARTLPDILRR